MVEIPKDIQGDLEVAVSILANSRIPVREIRLFGSLNNGNWINGKSDIDLYVLLENDFSDECFYIPLMFKGREAEELEIQFEVYMGQKSKNFHLYINTPSGEENISELLYNLYKNMKDGRLLYRRNET